MNLQSQVWSLYNHTNFKYCTLLKRNGVTDKRTTDPITRCPWQNFQAVGHKNQLQDAQDVAKYRQDSHLQVQGQGDKVKHYGAMSHLQGQGNKVKHYGVAKIHEFEL